MIFSEGITYFSHQFKFTYSKQSFQILSALFYLISVTFTVTFIKLLIEFYYNGIWVLTYYSQNDRKTASELIYNVISKSRIYLTLTKILLLNHLSDIFVLAIKKPFQKLKNTPYFLFGKKEEWYRSDSEMLSYLVIHGNSQFNLLKEGLFTKSTNSSSNIITGTCIATMILPLYTIILLFLSQNYVLIFIILFCTYNIVDISTKLCSIENYCWEVCIEFKSLNASGRIMNLNEKLNSLEHGEIFFRG